MDEGKKRFKIWKDKVNELIGILCSREGSQGGDATTSLYEALLDKAPRGNLSQYGLLLREGRPHPTDEILYVCEKLSGATLLPSITFKYNDSDKDITGFLLYDHSLGKGRKATIKSGGISSSSLKVHLGMGFFTSRYDVTFIIFGKKNVLEDIRKTTEDIETADSTKIEMITGIKQDEVEELTKITEETNIINNDEDLNSGNDEEATLTAADNAQEITDETIVVTDDHDDNKSTERFDNINSVKDEAATITEENDVQAITEESIIVTDDNDANRSTKSFDNVLSMNDETATTTAEDNAQEITEEIVMVTDDYDANKSTEIFDDLKSPNIEAGIITAEDNAQETIEECIKVKDDLDSSYGNKGSNETNSTNANESKNLINDTLEGSNVIIPESNNVIDNIVINDDNKCIVLNEDIEKHNEVNEYNEYNEESIEL